MRRLLLQQRALAGFGSFALRNSNLLSVLTEAARVCAEALSVPFCKVCRYRPDENDLLIEAGVGWSAGVVGHVVSRADASSPQGRAFITGLPAVCNDLRTDTQFVLPPFYADHGIISTIDVLIKGNGQPYGVLEIDNNRQHDYDQHDIDFVTGFANVLAEAVATAERSAAMEDTVAQLKRVLEQKNTLAEELQHRVRNSLHFIHNMLTQQQDGVDASAVLKVVARQVSTLAQVYDHLLGNEMTRTTDFGAFVTALCRGLNATQQGIRGTAITLSCDTEAALLDLDTVTALGLIVTELVTNSYEHAFPDRGGKITVSLHRPANDHRTGTLTVSDNGIGFVAGDTGNRHGLEVVHRLVEQVNGTIMVETVHGTKWVIGFPIPTA